eukprot:6190989-Pleurochrysis_carterae.AAC.1
MCTCEQERKAKKDEADKHKEAGNTAYKAKKFEEAIKVRIAIRIGSTVQGGWQLRRMQCPLAQAVEVLRKLSDFRTG